MKYMLAFFSLALAAPVSAQQVYKCADGVYQQTPCASGKKPEKVYRYTPEPEPAPRRYYPSASSRSFSYGGNSSARQQRSGGGGVIANPNSQRLQDKLGSIASDSRYKGSPSARRAAMNAAMQEAGYQGAGPYQAPPPASNGIGQPVQAIDARTGMPINGAIRTAPNQIWDPATGQYRDTY